jgi:hypothetical protein
LEHSILRLRRYAPGSRIESARDFGVDLNLLIANLRLTPAERVRRITGRMWSAIPWELRKTSFHLKTSLLEYLAQFAKALRILHR